MRLSCLLTLLVFCALVFTQCGNKSGYSDKYPTNKLAPNDPFAETMVASEFFTIDPKEDNIVEGVQGSIVFIPEGALLDKNGNPAKGEVKIELAEALTIEDMVTSNLTTTSNGKLLQTGGMLYLNATANGEPLHIDTTKPLRIEIPTDTKVEGMQAYRGIRDSAGNMNWVDPVPLIDYLSTVNLEDLDFLPHGFLDTLKENMPFNGHIVVDRALADSIYYSLLGFQNIPSQHVQPTNMNEAQYNPNKIENGKYTDESFNVKIGGYQATYQAEAANSAKNYDTTAFCGINPASVKVLKGKKFANTFIATREFEARMEHIHHTCMQKVLEAYINNIDKNLWEADKAAFDILRAKKDDEAGTFEEYYLQKKGKVKDGDKAAQKLKEYYNKQLKKVENELNKLTEKKKKIEAKAEKEFEEVKQEYREVLWKREKYRNQEKYRLTWTDMGWINVDTGTMPKPCPVTDKQIEITLTDNNTYDRVYVYALLTSITSLSRFNTSDNKTFYAGNDVKRSMLITCSETINAVAIAYKGKQAYFAKTTFYVLQENAITIDEELKAVSNSELKQLLRQLNSNRNYKTENSIEKDLEFQFKIYTENKRKEKQYAEYELMAKLYRLICNQCKGGELSLGKRLFEENCTACHSICSKVIGPALLGVTDRRTNNWLLSFTKNSSQMIMDGDPQAVELYTSWNKQSMTSFEFLTDKEISAIYDYISKEDCKNIGGNQ